MGSIRKREVVERGAVGRSLNGRLAECDMDEGIRRNKF